MFYTTVQYVNINSPLVCYCSGCASQRSGSNQNSERVSQDENYKFKMSQRFSDGCTERLKTDMGERRVISGMKGKCVDTNPVVLTNQPNNPLVIPLKIKVSKSLQRNP